MDTDRTKASIKAIESKMDSDFAIKQQNYKAEKAWLNAVQAAWDPKKYRTLGEFLASPDGEKFHRLT
jgi:hypothetical protein